MRLKEIHQRRGQLMVAMRALIDGANGREFTAEETAQYDRLTAEDDKLAAESKRIQHLEARESELAAATAGARQPVGTATAFTELGGIQGGSRGLEGEGEEDMEVAQALAAYRERHDFPEAFAKRNYRAQRSYRQAYNAWLRSGRALSPQYQAALAADSDIAGGYLVAPLAMTADLIKKLDDELFIRRLATVRQVVNAQSLGTPTLENDPADADWTSEIATGSEDSTMSFGRREWHPHPLAKLIKISNKLLRFDAAGSEALVVERLGYKFGVSEEKGFLTGSGASQALGLFTASSLGISTSRDISTGNTSIAIGADNLFEVKYAVKAQYQRNGVWLFHRDAIKAIRKLKDSQNQYLWQPGLSAGEPDRILDRPFYMSEFVPNTFTTGLYVGLFGDLRFYWIAEALAFQLQRLVELYATTNQTGFIGRMEVDGMPVLEEAFARVKLA